jgi:hydroxymethylpyrimidine pyrophosphatase-like HAD family hydrolase
VQDAGVGWVVATSRPPFWMGDVVEVVGSEGITVCSNGAFVYDVTRRRVVVKHALRTTLVTDLVIDLRAAIPDVVFGLEHQEGFVLEYGFSDESREADA